MDAAEMQPYPSRRNSARIPSADGAKRAITHHCPSIRKKPRTKRRKERRNRPKSQIKSKKEL
jgi:hypothetical protein